MKDNFFLERTLRISLFFVQLLRNVLITTFLVFTINLNSFAQSSTYVYSNALLAEKVYLQLDANIYTTGNIVWFKALVLGADHTPSLLSGVLYVELINSDERILEKKLIKIEDGTGQGFIFLNQSYPEGSYLVRAYTNWNKNFGKDFFFEEYIRVFKPQNASNISNPINNVTLVTNEDNENRLVANFNPFEIDSLHKNKLKVQVTLGEQKDSLYLRKNKNGKYKLDYKFTEENQFASLQMHTSNHKKYATTVVLNQEHFDLQFLPESGELVHGLTSKVGFKALNANGKGKMVQGDIINENDSILVSFKSNKLGTGSFILNRADSTKKYFARLKSEQSENEVLLYPLPKVAALGNILSVEKKNAEVYFTATSNYLENDSISLSVSYRGLISYKIKACLKEGVLRLKIPANKFPEGILACTLMNRSGQVLAERLYFNKPLGEGINVDITTSKTLYKKRELSEFGFSTTNAQGEPVKANMSLLVINKKQLGEMQEQRQNIESFFLLDSDLRGHVENPGFYFNKDSSMHHHLDALMLTQGWRKYNYPKVNAEINWYPETNLTVSGEVSSVFSKKKKKRAEMTLLTFGENKAIYTQIADSSGRFNFNLNDEYGDKVNVILQSSKKSGKKMNYTVKLDKKESPSVNFKQAKNIMEPDSVVQVLVEKNTERKKVDDAFPLQAGNILIEEVEVTALKLTPIRKKVIEEYGEPDEIIDGEEIRKKEEKWSYGLFSVLLFNFSDKVYVTRDRNKDLYAKLYNGELTLYIIDGIPVMPYEFPLLQSIPPSEVNSFEIMEYAPGFTKLYCEVYPSGCKNAPPWGNIIAIYTHAGKGIYGANQPVGIMRTSVPVYSVPREFYAPKYETKVEKTSYKPDLRALVHWEPILKTDSLGQASASFYNADNPGTMMVVVEVLTETGKVAYREFEYEVEGKETDIYLIE